MDILLLLFRTLLLYIIIVIAIRIMGKRQISELQTTELVVTLLISDLASIPMQSTDQSLFIGLLPILVLVICEIVASILMLKSGFFRKVICGKPTIIIDNGVIIQSKMKSLRMSTEELFVQLRQKDVFAIEEVRFGIIETNGMLTIMKKSDYTGVTHKDLSMQVQDKPLEMCIISDGEIAVHSLSLCEKDESWLIDTLNKHNLTPKEVFIMTADSSGNHHIVIKDAQ